MVPITDDAYEIADQYREQVGPQWVVSLEKLHLGMKSPSEMNTMDWLIPLAETDGELCLQLDREDITSYVTTHDELLVQLDHKADWGDQFAGPFTLTRPAVKRLLEQPGTTFQIVTQTNTDLSIQL